MRLEAGICLLHVVSLSSMIFLHGRRLKRMTQCQGSLTRGLSPWGRINWLRYSLGLAFVGISGSLRGRRPFRLPLDVRPGILTIRWLPSLTSWERRKQCYLTEGHQCLLTEGNQCLLTEGNQCLLTEGNQCLLTEGKQCLLTQWNQCFLTEGNQCLLTEGNQSSLTEGNQCLLTEGNQCLLTEGNQCLLTEGNQCLLTEGNQSLLNEETNFSWLKETNKVANLRGFRDSMNPRFEGGILDFTDRIADFMDNFTFTFILLRYIEKYTGGILS